VAKRTITYPATGITVTTYETTRRGPVEETPGKVIHMPGMRYYLKPTFGILIPRKPGVRRVSEDVRAINKKLEALTDKPEHPSRLCGGLSWPERGACLRREMKKVITPVV